MLQDLPSIYCGHRLWVCGGHASLLRSDVVWPVQHRGSEDFFPYTALIRDWTRSGKIRRLLSLSYDNPPDKRNQENTSLVLSDKNSFEGRSSDTMSQAWALILLVGPLPFVGLELLVGFQMSIGRRQDVSRQYFTPARIVIHRK